MAGRCFFQQFLLRRVLLSPSPHSLIRHYPISLLQRQQQLQWRWSSSGSSSNGKSQQQKSPGSGSEKQQQPTPITQRKFIGELRHRLDKFLALRQQLDKDGTSREHWKKWLVARTREGREHRALRLKQKTEAESAEQVPPGLFKRLHYYIKRYWWIALPIHTLVCAAWFGALYLAVESGLDAVSLMEQLHLPASWVHKVRDMPKAAGSLAIALVLYKVATPARYACTLLVLRMIPLQRLSRLPTARQLQYRTRQRLDPYLNRLDERRSLLRRNGRARKRTNGNGNGSGNGHKQQPGAGQQP